ncbi:MAG: hypothetical protein E7467_06500 [Ruminococcaceae bacterium]|nr:hypothetical protein [Oscillospiraceae bacterium]
MQNKRSVTPLLPIFGFGCIVGCVARYFQRKYELLADGSLKDGAYLHTVLLILSLLFVAGSIACLWKQASNVSHTQFTHHFGIFSLLAAGAALLLIGNTLLLLSGQEPTSIYVASAPGFSAFLNKLLPPLGIAAALCVFCFVYRCFYQKKPSPLLYMCLSLYLIVRLIVRFQAWNTDPSVHDYCYALLANIATMLASFHIAGFSFDKGKRRMSLFWLMCSALFCSITLADTFYDGDLGELFVHLALLLCSIGNCLQLALESKEDSEF